MSDIHPRTQSRENPLNQTASGWMMLVVVIALFIVGALTVEFIIGVPILIVGAGIIGMSCARVCPVEVLCVGDCVYNRLGQQENLILTTGVAYTNIVGVPSVEMPQLSRVQSGDFTNSYLYRKIIGQGITGDRMPQTGPALTAAQMKLVRDWIRRGAPND